MTFHLRDFHRQTNDLDITVAVSLAELIIDFGKLPGWSRHPRREQEWRSPEDVRVDLIPIAPDLLAAGYVTWPESGFRMSLLGFRHALEQVRSVSLDSGLTINVASVPTIFLLKTIAYQERPEERAKDLSDIAYILEGYIADDDPRRFGEDVIASGTHYEDVSSFILGRDLAAMANSEERGEIEAFIARARDESDGGRAQSVMLRQGPAAWHRNPRELMLRFGALESGLHYV